MILMRRAWLVYRNGVTALEEINLQVNKGEFVFLVGPTGCGKSSLLKLVSFEEPPSRGRVVVAGQNVLDVPRHKTPFWRRRIGVIFQDFKLLKDKNVYENVAFALEVTGTRPEEIRTRVPHVLSLVGLEHKAREHTDELSGGERQRVSLARAIVNRPKILLADEPTGNLDPATSREILDLLLRIHQGGTTVIVATHDHAIVGYRDRRVVQMKAGGIVKDQETTSREELVRMLEGA